MRLLILLLIILFTPTALGALIDRQTIVRRYNPTRNLTSLLSSLNSTSATPMQIGSGTLAFGSDITGLQTFLPFAIMTQSSWGWKNDSLPPGRDMEDILRYRGVEWVNHGREVRYEFSFGGGDAEAEVQQWLIANPNRVNLGRVGLLTIAPDGTRIPLDVSHLSDVNQTLDLWTGILNSTFKYQDSPIEILTASHQSSESISIIISSPLLTQNGNKNTSQLALFIDFPWCDGTQKFSAPYVGSYNMTSNHTTKLFRGSGSDMIKHTMVNNTFYTTLSSPAGPSTPYTISRDSPSAHRYTLIPSLSPHNASTPKFSLTLTFSPTPPSPSLLKSITPASSFTSSRTAWSSFWSDSGFVDVFTGSTDPRADELQRRIILSRYLERVNAGGDWPPQESGLVNNGWYGKFHLEVYFFHTSHWILWSNPSIFNLTFPSIYERFLPTSIQRAQIQQSWGPDSGARWGKMSDPSGRSAPGEINELLIWQQPHALLLALYTYISYPTPATLQRLLPIVRATADWMTSPFAYPNHTTGGGLKYDLGPPMYVVSEDTNPNVTRNPAFEGAYWRLGLEIAQFLLSEAKLPTPERYTRVLDNLAPLPVGQDGLYAVYEGIEDNFWDDPKYTNDHPALVGLVGWLPPVKGVDVGRVNRTRVRVEERWNVSGLWGWDFPLLALSSARLHQPSSALSWLLHPAFTFDDVGMPGGGTKVPTPYFTGSGALLYAVGMMAEGWGAWDDFRGVESWDAKGGEKREGRAPGFPGKEEGWDVRVEGMNRAV